MRQQCDCVEVGYVLIRLLVVESVGHVADGLRDLARYAQDAEEGEQDDDGEKGAECDEAEASARHAATRPKAAAGEAAQHAAAHARAAQARATRHAATRIADACCLFAAATDAVAVVIVMMMSVYFFDCFENILGVVVDVVVFVFLFAFDKSCCRHFRRGLGRLHLVILIEWKGEDRRRLSFLHIFGQKRC